MDIVYNPATSHQSIVLDVKLEGKKLWTTEHLNVFFPQEKFALWTSINQPGLYPHLIPELSIGCSVGFSVFQADDQVVEFLLEIGILVDSTGDFLTGVKDRGVILSFEFLRDLG